MGETKKIRIGNDIRLAVDLRQYIDPNFHLQERQVYDPKDQAYEDLDNDIWVNRKNEVYYPNQYSEGSVESPIEYKFRPGFGTPVSIRSVKAFLINTTLQQDYEKALKDKTRFISRFPMEPYYLPYEPNPYDICSSGFPGWRAYPRRHLYMPYAGFGVHPHFGGIYKPLACIKSGIEYVANVMATKDQHVVEVSFPARAQRFTGSYKLIIVAELYAPGFNNHNLKTITVDMPNVFELVKTTEEGVDTGIMINVNNVVDILPDGDQTQDVVYDDIYVNDGEFGNDSIALGRTDGSTVTVDTSSVTGWWEE